MQKPNESNKLENTDSDAIGFMFVTLGITMQTRGRWLFIVAGMLFLAQGFLERRNSNKEKQRNMNRSGFP